MPPRRSSQSGDASGGSSRGGAKPRGRVSAGRARVAGTLRSDPMAAATATAGPLESLQTAYGRLKSQKKISASCQAAGDALPADELGDYARSIALEEFIRSSNPEVRLWAAKCMAEVFRIFALEAPLEKENIRGVLQLFIKQLEVLREESSRLYEHAFALLETLTEFQEFVLIFRCDEPDELLCSLVTTCLLVAKSATSELLVQLLSGILVGAACKEIPQAVLASLVEELMPQRKSASASKVLVNRLLGSLAHRSIALPINEYLNANIYAEQGSPEEDNGSRRGKRLSEERLQAFLLVVPELFRIDPALVARVLPKLQADLQSTDPHRRRAVTAIVGQMLAHWHEDAGSSRPLLASTHPLLVDRHRERLGDADEGVRLTALEGSATILQAAASLLIAEEKKKKHIVGVDALLGAAELLLPKVSERSLDPNDEIRRRAVKLAANVASSSVSGLSLMEPVLPHIFKRLLDKKQQVRETCVASATNLYAKHALPAWTDANLEGAGRLSWIPQLLCEAYSLFCGGRYGQVALLEEYIEQHMLGCGAQIEEDKRALAFLGFYVSASQGTEAAQRGLALLLGKKRDAHAILRQYLKARIAKGAPLLARTASALVGALVPREQSAEASGDQEPGIAVLENLAKMSPTLDERAARPEAILMHLEALDSVRDKAVWAELEHLTDPCMMDTVEALSDHLQKLDEKLVFHKLTALAPLIRRALHCTWASPSFVVTFLDLWDGKGPESVPESNKRSRQLAAAARQVIADLPRYFPGLFLSHASSIASHLDSAFEESRAADARASLRALAAMGKRLPALQKECCSDLPLSAIDANSFTMALIKAIAAASEDIASRRSATRKAAKSLELLTAEARAHVIKQLLVWAKDEALEHSSYEEHGSSLEFALESHAAALHLVAAMRERPGWRQTFEDLDSEVWLEEARRVLRPGVEQSPDVRCAAAELTATCGREGEIVDVLLAPADALGALPIKADAEEAGTDVLGNPQFDPLPAHAACCVIQALRRGASPLSTLLLTRLGARICFCLAPPRPTNEAEQLLKALQALQRPPAVSHVRLADRLRLCVTLPTLFTFAMRKPHRDLVQRILQASLLKAARQCGARQEPLLDFSVACFVHFLSRLDVFQQEVAAAVSAFPLSSQVSAFFCDALLRSDPQQSAEFAGVALRVCDRVRYFVDRDDPSSDSVHRAASVLRYVVEKRCPELGMQSGVLLQEAKRGSMPAELFAVRQASDGETAKLTPALPAAPDGRLAQPLPAAQHQEAIVATISSAGQANSPDRAQHSSERCETPPEQAVMSPAPRIEAPSPASPARAARTTSTGRQSLLKRGVSPTSSSVASERGMAVSSVARPMPPASDSPNFTGAAIRAALSARAGQRRATTKQSPAKRHRAS